MTGTEISVFSVTSFVLVQSAENEKPYLGRVNMDCQILNIFTSNLFLQKVAIQLSVKFDSKLLKCVMPEIEMPVL